MEEVVEKEIRLTPKQEAFCQAIFNGMNQSDAYRHAYNAENMKPNTIYRRAWELRASGNITARINELHGDLTEKTMWDKEKASSLLIDIIMASYEDENGTIRTATLEKDRIAAIKELNDLHGTKAASKTELTGANGSPLGLADFFKLKEDEKE